jgi:hypothetical protein
MQMSPSALLTGDCYVTKELCVLLIVITAAILHNERCCAGYVTTSVNTNEAACFYWCQIFIRLDKDYG